VQSTNARVRSGVDGTPGVDARRKPSDAKTNIKCGVMSVEPVNPTDHHRTDGLGSTFVSQPSSAVR
jgi:hypothetical protein